MPHCSIAQLEDLDSRTFLSKEAAGGGCTISSVTVRQLDSASGAINHKAKNNLFLCQSSIVGLKLLLQNGVLSTCIVRQLQWWWK